MTHVLHIAGTINLGGGARAVRTLSQNLPSDFVTHFVAFNTPGPKFDEFKQMLGNVFCAQGDVSKVVEYITSHDIRILHLHGRGVMTDYEREIITQTKSHVKVLYTNIFGEFDKETDELVDRMVFKSKHAFTQKFVPYTGLNLSSTDWATKYVVIPNPVDVEYFETLRPNHEEVQNFKQSQNISSDVIVLGKIGSRKAIEKWSDLPLLALPQILKKHPKTVMLLQGVPDSRLGWAKQFKNNVRLIEETTDDRYLALLYNTLDIFTHASKIGEHSGNSINEAMFWAKPVIVNLTPTKDNGQIEQVVRGETGFFANSSGKYSEYTLQLMQDVEQRKAFGVAGRELVLKNNHAKDVTADYLSAYLSLSTNSEMKMHTTPNMIREFKEGYESNLQLNLALAGASDLSLDILSELYWKFRDKIDYNLNSKP